MKSSYPRLRAIRPTRCNPILTVTTIREIAEHNGANVITSFRDQRGYGVRFAYASPPGLGILAWKDECAPDEHPAVVEARRGRWHLRNAAA